MPVILTCPNPACGRECRAAETAAGKKVRCPHCRQTFSTSLSGTATVAPPSTADDSSPRLAKPVSTTATVTALPGIQSVGRFVVRGKLGEGAFGAVYRAFDPHLDREVALKVPHAAVLDSPKRVERFLREAKAAANLRHPHIVPVFDAGSDGGRHYIASAFINGQKLADAVEQSGGGMEFARAARLVRELAEALAYAHGQGIVHRDVKPDNVMLDQADHVHLMDFGLAMKQDAESRLTSDGAVMGTPAYMAPEQARGDTAAVGPAADQYACGVVLYELLTGQTPFAGPIQVVIHNQIHTDPDPPRKLRTKLPKDLETVCLKAMAKRPEDRYADCQALADDLRRYLEGEPVTARPAGAVEKAIRWVRKNPARAGLGVTGAVAVVLLGVAVGFAVLGLQAEFARNQAQAAEGNAVKARGAAVQAKGEADEAREAEEVERKKADQAAADLKVKEAEARASQKEAVDQKNEAEKQKGIAQEEAKKARKAEDEAKKAKQTVEQANELLKLEQKKLEVVRYGRTMQVAYQEWRDNNPTAMRVLLDGVTDQNLRGWEWEYLNRLHDPTLLTLDKHTGEVVGVGFGQDGKQVLTGTTDGAAKVWDAQTGNPVHTFPKFAGSVRVAFSPDGKRVVTGDGKGDLQVWDTTTWEEGILLKGHTQNVTAAAFSTDGKRLVTGSLDDTARVWDPSTALAVELKHPDDVWAVAVGPKGDRVATVCGDMIVRVWDLPDVKNPLKLKHPAVVKAVAFNPDGSRLATAGVDRTVRVWDAATGGQVLTLSACPATVLAVVFNPDGTRIASAGEDHLVRVWDATTGQEVLTLKGHTDKVNVVAFTRTGDRLITGSDDKTVKVWDAVNGAEYLPLVGHPDPVNAVTFSPKGFQVVTAGEDNTVRVWDPATGRELFKLLGHTKPVLAAAYAAESGRLVTAGGQDKKALVWDVNNQKSISLDHNEWVRAAAVSPDGKRVVTGCTDGTAKVWEVSTEKALFSLAGHTGKVNAAAFSKAGDRIVTGCDDYKGRLWDAKSESTGVELVGHTKPVLAAAFDPNGKWVVTASADQTAKVWDVASGKVLLTLKGHTAAVAAVAVHPTEKRIVTAGHDKTVKVWDPETGAELLTLKGFPQAAHAVAWSAAGNQLVVGGGGGTARVYDSRSFRNTRPPKPENKK